MWKRRSKRLQGLAFSCSGILVQPLVFDANPSGSRIACSYVVAVTVSSKLKSVVSVCIVQFASLNDVS
jgi:hypothetical protein